MIYKPAKQLIGFKELERFGLAILSETVSNFFSCSIEILTDPQKVLKGYQIDILKNDKRGFYPISDDDIIILGRIFENKELLSCIGLRLNKIGIKKSARFLTVLEGSLTKILTEEYLNSFKSSKYLLGDQLILNTITHYFARGGYDYRHIRHLIGLFNKLRTTSFEGQYFSSGLILTQSHFDFNQKEKRRFGETHSLKKPISLANTNKIERRFWYLVDGKTSYFICNKSLVLTQIFILDERYQSENYINNQNLSKSLKGFDILFKQENEKLFSIINSENIEVSYFENQWKFRDYSFVRALFKDHFNDATDIIESLLFYIIYCSKNSISTIIWLPNSISKIDELVKKDTKNKFIKSDIPITDKAFTNHILRYISSDGASVIDKNGLLQYFGCIVDLGRINIKGVKGTGESAAELLASNGIAIKVSQDGTIKVFSTKTSKPIIL